MTPIEEIKHAVEIAARHSVDIYAPHTENNSCSTPAVLLRDIDTFKAIKIDGTSRADYCLAGFQAANDNEEGGELIYRVQKISDGVRFWIEFEDGSPAFEELYAELSVYIDEWDSKHPRKAGGNHEA